MPSWRETFCQSMESVLFGSDDAAAQTAQHWQPGQGRVVAACCEVPTRPVEWAQLIREADECSSLPSLVPPRTPEKEAIRRGLTAQSRVQREQVSRALQALIGAALAPRIRKRWMHCRTDAHKNVSPTSHRRCWIFNHSVHCSWTQSCSRSVCVKPHLDFPPVLCFEDNDLFQLLHSASEDFASGLVPPTVGRALMLATITALRKDDGGTGLAFRRLVAKCLARQFGKEVEAACSPF